MKTLACCALLIGACAAQAASDQRARLVGQHRAFTAAPVLVCEYSGTRARFEIVSQNGLCAPYLLVQ